jgi:hypothetical protein
MTINAHKTLQIVQKWVRNEKDISLQSLDGKKQEKKTLHMYGSPSKFTLSP